MKNEVIKNHKAAAEEQARRAGQANKKNVDVTPEIMSLLYNALVRAHIAFPSTETLARNGAGGSP